MDPTTSHLCGQSKQLYTLRARIFMSPNPARYGVGTRITDVVDRCPITTPNEAHSMLSYTQSKLFCSQIVYKLVFLLSTVNFNSKSKKVQAKCTFFSRWLKKVMAS